MFSEKDHYEILEKGQIDQISSRFMKFGFSKLLSTTAKMEYFISYLINMSMWSMTFKKSFDESDMYGKKYILELVKIYEKYYKKKELNAKQKQILENEILISFLEELFPEKIISKNFLRQRKKCAQEKISPQEFFESFSMEQLAIFKGKRDEQ